jgi:hypothetical protein
MRKNSEGYVLAWKKKQGGKVCRRKCGTIEQMMREILGSSSRNVSSRSTC